MNKRDTGITLIALIITVIVLLILAGTAISISINSGNIFSKTQSARELWNTAVENENTQLSEVLQYLDGSQENTLLSQITPADYGKSINYSASITDQSSTATPKAKVSLNNWKIFYKDESHVYIILDDCLNAKLAPANVNILTDSSNNYAKKYSIWSSNGASTVYEYLTGDNWGEFASGISDATATGGPTLEQINASLGREANSTEAINNELSNYTLYVPNTMGNTNNLYGYWMATLYINQATLRFVNYEGRTNSESQTIWQYSGIRPVVCLPTNATGTVGETSVTLDI